MEQTTSSAQGHPAIRWVDEWSVPGLSDLHRRQIRAVILKAHAAFFRYPGERFHAGAIGLQQAFDAIAGVLFKAGILTDEILQNELPAFVWDSGISAGWHPYASDVRSEQYPSQLGHYWVYRDHNEDWAKLFEAETAEWQGKLLELRRGKSRRSQNAG